MRGACLRFLVALFLLAAAGRPAGAQVIVIDDVILLSRSESERQQGRTRGHLTPVGTESPLPPAPGSDEPLLEGPSRVGPRLSTHPQPRHTEHRPDGHEGERFITFERPAGASSALPAGPLELPADDDGPPDGLPLDLAIDRLLATNYDLRIRFQELPKADADVLSAGLRNNPFLFVSADAIPYGSFSAQRPGATLYDITLIQPIDVSGKRRNRLLVARQARQVLEAQYQNSVRREIDRLYTAFLDVLEAREAVRAARAGAAGAADLARTTQDLVRRGRRPEAEASRAAVLTFHAETALHEAEAALAHARRNLATLLAVPPDRADCVEVRDSVHDRAPPPPCARALVELALRVRPDLAAFRLGVERARADVSLARSEGLEDVFLFYTPWTATDFTPEGQRVASGWGLGVLLPIPVFNRNQGNVRRARVNVTQVQIELEALERQVVNEVRQAHAEYESSREAVLRYEKEGLPAAARLRDQKLRRYAEGAEGLDGLLQAQKEYAEMVRHYLAALLHHRRSMLALNTAVGQRLLP